MKKIVAGLALCAVLIAFPAVGAVGTDGAVYVDGAPQVNPPDVDPDDLEQYCTGGGSIGSKIVYRYWCDL